MSEKIAIPRINNLPPSLINQIAAGEVIERPASVVKELIENAIDSGADRIDIEIASGGTEKIIIRDNGCGIHPDDMEMAILRHSTSKLSSQQDLDVINSLGFRGEALSSIASISDFTISSRSANEEYAKKIVFNPYTGTHVISPAAHQSGTTVEVYKLFQPVPARRKFLRSNKTEFLHVQEIVRRFVLSRFDIDFSFQHNGKLIINSPAVESDYRIRIAGVMGNNFYTHAWPIDSRVEGMQLWGWLGNEETARSQSDRQYLYLNKRIIRDKHINHAIRKVLDDIIVDARYPSYILHLIVDPSTVDVNVHPTKQEVRFKNPRDVHDFIYAALNDAIRQELPLRSESGHGHVNNVAALKSGLEYERASANLKHLGTLYASVAEAQPVSDINSPLGTPVALLYENYLLTRYEDEVRIIDYNELRRFYLDSSLKKQLSTSGVGQRPLLVPVMLTFKESMLSVIMSYQNMLERLGIGLVQSGPQTLSVRSIPALLPDIDISRLFPDLIELLLRNPPNSDSIENDSLSIIVGQVCESERKHYLFEEIQQELPLFFNLELPFAEKNYASIWSTLSEKAFLKLLND